MCSYADNMLVFTYVARIVWELSKLDYIVFLNLKEGNVYDITAENLFLIFYNNLLIVVLFAFCSVGFPEKGL